MDRDQLQRNLALYADDALDEQTRAAVEAEINADPALADVVADWRALRLAARRGLDQTATPTDLAQRIQTRLAAENPSPGASRPGVWRWRAATLSAAAVVVLTILLWPAASPEATPLHPREIWTRHLRCVGAPGEDALAVRGLSPAEAEARLRQQFGFPVRLPDLQDHGWRLAGAMECRVDCPGTTAKVVHAFYSPPDNGPPVSFFSLATPVQLAGGCKLQQHRVGRITCQEAVAQTEAGELLIMAWHTHDAGYAACGALASEQMHALFDPATQVARSPAPPLALASQPR